MGLRQETLQALLANLPCDARLCTEAATAALFLIVRPSGIPAWVAWLGIGLLAVIWISTPVLQVPEHGRLTEGFDAGAHSRLVGTNWIRTIAWTARGLLLGWATCLLLATARA